MTRYVSLSKGQPRLGLGHGLAHREFPAFRLSMYEGDGAG
jgi:hypothetical protein